jgi:hypothetical protein
LYAPVFFEALRELTLKNSAELLEALDSPGNPRSLGVSLRKSLKKMINFPIYIYFLFRNDNEGHDHGSCSGRAGRAEPAGFTRNRRGSEGGNDEHDNEEHGDASSAGLAGGFGK